MKDEHKTKKQLINELEAEIKRKRAEEAQDKESNCLRILVVDDDRTALDFYQEVLCSTINLQGSKSTTGDLEAKLFGNRSPKVSIPSFDVTLRHQGDEAVETVRAAIGENKPFAVVFLDVRLPPGPDGVWTAERIRALDPYVQIIMVTGYSDVNPLELACQVPPVDRLFYVQKPLDPQEVRQFASALGAKWHVEKRLRKIHTELEDQVKERTAELAKANEELRIEIAERKRAEEKLQESEERYRMLIQQSVEAIYMFDPETKHILEANPAFLNLLGYKAGEVHTLTIYDFVAHHRKSIDANIQHILTSGGTTVGERAWRRKDGVLIDVQVTASKIWQGGKNIIFIVARDITERKRAEEALRESEAKLAGIVGAVTDHMSMIDEQHNIVWVNHIAKRLFGPDLVGKKCYTAYHGRDKVCKSCIVKKTFADGKSHEHETEVIGADGRKMNFWCTCNVAAWYPDGRPKLVIGVSRNITERKRAEEALQESEEKLRFLSSHLLTAQERERRRVSIELHDELGQALTVLKLKLRSIKRKLGTDQTVIKQDCEDTLHYIDQVVENVRRLSRDLSPSILDDLGLSAALRWLIHDFTEYYNIKTSLDMEDISNLFSGEAQIMIYRIFQESLTNIGKHAQATSVSIVVKREDSSVSFLVEDDGKGFDVKQVLARNSTERGLGLAAMDERARMLGGSINIWSQEGKGSRITFTIPMYEGGSS